MTQLPTCPESNPLCAYSGSRFDGGCIHYWRSVAYDLASLSSNPDREPSILVTFEGDTFIHLWTQAHHSHRVRTLCGLIDGKTYNADDGLVLDCPNCWRILECCRGESAGQILAALEACIPKPPPEDIPEPDSDLVTVNVFADRCIAHALEHNAPRDTCAECDSGRDIALKRIDLAYRLDG